VTGVERDYREILIFKKLVHNLNKCDLSSYVHTYPHRYFLGFKTRSHGLNHPESGSCQSCRMMPDEMKREREKELGYAPHVNDIRYVRWMLGRKGLPPELSNLVMREADYDRPRRWLPVPGDPLHPRNRDALDMYLGYCWKILVRCDMVALSLYCDPIEWGQNVCLAIRRLFLANSWCGEEWCTEALRLCRGNEGLRRRGMKKERN